MLYMLLVFMSEYQVFAWNTDKHKQESVPKSRRGNGKPASLTQMFRLPTLEETKPSFNVSLLLLSVTFIIQLLLSYELRVSH